MPLHVDYEIRWKNYRCFRDTGWIVIRPLTILIGPNNVGKTSVISPILLLNQTMTSLDAVTPLVTRGPLIDAGTFRDIIYSHDLSRELFLGFRFHVHEPNENTGEVGQHPPGALEITLRSWKQPQEIILRKYEIFDIFKRPYCRRSRRPSGTYTLEGMKMSAMNPAERRGVHESRPVNFLFSPSSALYEYRQPRRRRAMDRDKESQAIDFSKDFSIYLSSIGYVYEELLRIFESLSYVGPLRDRPKRYYEIAGEIPRSVGPRGENTANLLYRRFDELDAELAKWVRRFEFGDHLRRIDLSENLFSIAFQTENSSSETNIADAGFGASQVLPMVVQALAAREGSLTIAEQPEIHLNPKLQSVLADLFVEMANSDHRLIVETHSEHLLLRLRRLIASGKIEHTRVAIYFIERHENASRIRPIPMDATGHIDPNAWPKGFFEETLRESIGLAQEQAKARTREKRKR